jgi:hypothetical protein
LFSPFFRPIELFDGTIFFTPTKKGDFFMTSHEFDTHCDTLPYQEPDYHEQAIVMQEMEVVHDNALRQQGAIEALQNLSITLSKLILRDSVEGEYLFGLHTALEVVKHRLDIARGGVA